MRLEMLIGLETFVAIAAVGRAAVMTVAVAVVRVVAATAATRMEAILVAQAQTAGAELGRNAGGCQ